MRPSRCARAGGGCRAGRAATARRGPPGTPRRRTDALCSQRVRRVHQLKMQVRGGRVAGVADTSEHLAGADLLPSRDGDAARREVRIQRVHPSGSHDHVVAGKPGGIQPSPREDHRVLHREPGLPHGVEPLALGHAVHGLDDHAVEGRMDRLPPAVAVTRPPPDQDPAQGPRGVQMEPGAVVGADQVVGVPLSEQVGAVAGDPVRRGPLDRPLASKGKLDRDRVIELTHRRCSIPPYRLLPSGHLRATLAF
jgi:hypothetical protein